MTADWVIDTDALTKRYGQEVLAVDSLTLRVRRGEVYGFVGPNGAGKTTTLRMLLGLVRPSSGAASVLGHRPGSPEALARVGAMIEAPDFYPFLSGRDNLRVMARHTGVPVDRIEDVLRQVGLSQRADDHFSTHSTGMKQRLGLAAGLLKDPEVLILDEPTNGLDPEGIAEMRVLVRSLGREHRTVLLSSHLMGEVEQVCDRIGVIRHGRLAAEGTLDELRGRQQLRVRVTPMDRARELVAALPGVDNTRVADGVLMLTTDPRRAGEINRQLLDHGLVVSELTPVHATLEEVFLGLVREEGANSHG
ncbi:MAG: ATP-binding cassette domain-containing protein [Actinomycetota bacterium]